MALRELLAQFGIEVDTEKLDHANEKLNGFIEKVEKVGKQVLTAFAVKEVFEFGEAIARQIHQVEATSAALGISTQATQEYGFASQAAGMDAGELLNMMGRLQVSAANASKGMGDGGKAFSVLGVKVKDASGKVKAADVLLEDVAEGIRKTEDPAKRAALATELFGRQGRALLPFLVKGRTGIQELRKEFGELGGGFDEEAIEKSKEFEHGMARIHVVVDGIKGAIVKGLFPVLTWIANKAAAIGGFFVNMTKHTNIFRNALIVLAAYLTPLALSMAAAFAPVLLAGAALAAIVLLIDDIITLFEGGDSVIGETIDKLFGKGSAADTVYDLKRAWEGIRDTFKDLANYVSKVVDGFKYLTGDNKPAVSHGKDFGPQTEAEAKKEEAQLSEEKKRASDKAMRDIFGNTTVDAAQWNPGGAKDKPIWDAVFAPPNIPGVAAPAAQAGSGGDVNVEVNVQGTSVTKPEIRDAVEQGVRAAKQSANRAALHTLTQVGAKP